MRASTTAGYRIGRRRFIGRDDRNPEPCCGNAARYETVSERLASARARHRRGDRPPGAPRPTDRRGRVVMSGAPFPTHSPYQRHNTVGRPDRRTLTRLIVEQQLNAQVLRTSGTADLNYLGFVARVRPDRLRWARDDRGATTSHHAARNGQLSVLR